MLMVGSMQHTVLACEFDSPFCVMERFSSCEVCSVVAVCAPYSHICWFSGRCPHRILEALQVG